MKKFTIIILGLALSLTAMATDYECVSDKTSNRYHFKQISSPLPLLQEETAKIYLNGKRVGKTAIFSGLKIEETTFISMSSRFYFTELSKMRYFDGDFVLEKDGSFRGKISYDWGRFKKKKRITDFIFCQMEP